MKPTHPQARLKRSILLCCALLSGIVVIEFFVAGERAANGNYSGVSVVPERAELAAFDAPAFEKYGEVLSRPLFYKDRKLPPQPRQAEPEQIPLEPLDLSLEGVAIANTSKVALLRNQNGNELIQLAEGMSHNGWVLVSVESTGAAFRRGGDVTELEIEASNRSPRRRFRR